jgi:hypothetical protein
LEWGKLSDEQLALIYPDGPKALPTEIAVQGEPISP